MRALQALESRVTLVWVGTPDDAIRGAGHEVSGHRHHAVNMTECLMAGQRDRSVRVLDSKYRIPMFELRCAAAAVDARTGPIAGVKVIEIREDWALSQSSGSKVLGWVSFDGSSQL